MKTNPEERAFPAMGTRDGLTKREYFAALAMHGILSNPSESDITADFVKTKLGLDKDTKYDPLVHWPMFISMLATKHADALIEQLNKTQK